MTRLSRHTTSQEYTKPRDVYGNGSEGTMVNWLLGAIGAVTAGAVLSLVLKDNGEQPYKPSENAECDAKIAKPGDTYWELTENEADKEQNILTVVSEAQDEYGEWLFPGMKITICKESDGVHVYNPDGQ